MFAGLGRIYRSISFGSTGTLSLGRVVIFGLMSHVFIGFWLYVAWIWYLTATGQLETAAAFHASMANILAGLGSSSVLTSVGMYLVTKKFGEAGAASQAQVLDPNATVGASVVPAAPAPTASTFTVTDTSTVEVTGSDPNNPGGI